MRRIQQLTPLAFVVLTVGFVAAGLPIRVDAEHYDAGIVWSIALASAFVCGAWLRHIDRLGTSVED